MFASRTGISLRRKANDLRASAFPFPSTTNHGISGAWKLEMIICNQALSKPLLGTFSEIDGQSPIIISVATIMLLLPKHNYQMCVTAQTTNNHFRNVFITLRD